MSVMINALASSDLEQTGFIFCWGVVSAGLWGSVAGVTEDYFRRLDTFRVGFGAEDLPRADPGDLNQFRVVHVSRRISIESIGNDLPLIIRKLERIAIAQVEVGLPVPHAHQHSLFRLINKLYWIIFSIQ